MSYFCAVFKIFSVDDESFEEKQNLRVGKHVNLNYCAADMAWNQTDGTCFFTMKPAKLISFYYSFI